MSETRRGILGYLFGAPVLAAMPLPALASALSAGRTMSGMQTDIIRPHVHFLPNQLQLKCITDAKAGSVTFEGVALACIPVGTDCELFSGATKIGTWKSSVNLVTGDTLTLDMSI